MKINHITKDKISGKWYMDVSTLDSGNGAEVQISEATAKELINKFGLKLEHGLSTDYYYC